LLDAPDTATFKGVRDQAILAVLPGCGLRRSEPAALTFVPYFAPRPPEVFTNLARRLRRRSRVRIFPRRSDAGLS
jgi:integrase